MKSYWLKERGLVSSTGEESSRRNRLCCSSKLQYKEYGKGGSFHGGKTAEVQSWDIERAEISSLLNVIWFCLRHGINTKFKLPKPGGLDLKHQELWANKIGNALYRKFATRSLNLDTSSAVLIIWYHFSQTARRQQEKNIKFPKFLSQFRKIFNSSAVFHRFPNIKFHVNPSTESRNDTCEQAGEETEGWTGVTPWYHFCRRERSGGDLISFSTTKRT